MNTQKLLQSISENLARFKAEVEILNAGSMLDINIAAEDFLIPILNEIYDCELINANTEEKNYPAVDLIDKKNRISFQITSTATLDKIRKTLEKIVQNKFYEEYDKFYIVIIKKKEKKYSIPTINRAKANKFDFTNENILDVDAIFTKIKSLPFEKIRKIEKYLKSQYEAGSDKNVFNFHNEGAKIMNQGNIKIESQTFNF